MSEATSKDGIEVKRGQIWRDQDKHMPNRYCKVSSVRDGKTIKSAIEADLDLANEMVGESHPLYGQYRYRGGRASKKVQAVLDAAVDAVTQQIRLPKPCAAILIER